MNCIACDILLNNHKCFTFSLYIEKFVYFCIVNDIICCTVKRSSKVFYSRKAGAEVYRQRS